MLTRFPTVLLQPLGHLSGKLRCTRASSRAIVKWRRERDSNPRYAYAYSGFRDRPIQPLSHLSAGENTRIVAPFPARKSLAALDFAVPAEYDFEHPIAWKVPCPERVSPIRTVLRRCRCKYQQPRRASLPCRKEPTRGS